MPSLSYEKIFSRFRNKVNDPKELSLHEEDLSEIYNERLHSVAGNERVNKLFSTLLLNDQTEEITWELRHFSDVSNTKDSDEDFVVELFTQGMVLEWFRPQVDTITYIGMAIGGKEEKTINNMHKTNVERLNILEKQFYKMIRDHGYRHNEYLKD